MPFEREKRKRWIPIFMGMTRREMRMALVNKILQIRHNGKWG